MFLIIFIQLVKLQVVDSAKYLSQSQSKLSSTETITAPRGKILDRYGRPIVTNRLGFSVSFTDSSLSDDELNLQRWKMPDVNIGAGEVYTVVCNNNSEKSALKKYQTNFSLKTGETLYLSDESGKIISSVAVVDMEENQSLSIGLDGLYRIGGISENTHIEN